MYYLGVAGVGERLLWACSTPGRARGIVRPGAVHVREVPSGASGRPACHTDFRRV